MEKKSPTDSVTLTFNDPRALSTKKDIDRSDGVRKNLVIITELIHTEEGTNASDIATKRSKSKPAIERYLRIARQVGIVEFKGAPKTGGYYLTRKMQSSIKL